MPSGEQHSSPVFTNPLWEQIRDRAAGRGKVFAWGDTPFDLARGGAVQAAQGLYVSGGFFDGLGIQPAAGRLLGPGDDRTGCPALAVLSYAFWQAHWSGAASAIGQTLSLDRHSFQIIGVSAAGFYGTEVGHRFDVAVPICTAAIFDAPRSRLAQRSWWWLHVMGRMPAGHTLRQAEAGWRGVSPAIMEAALPERWSKQSQRIFLATKVEATPAATGVSPLRHEFGQPLLVLMAVAGLVLLIACANIGSLTLARSAARQPELALRLALGASRGRLIRQLLTESILLAGAGAGLGLLAARWGSQLMVRYIATGNNPVFLNLALDGRVLAFTAAVAIFAGLLCGLWPAMRATHIPLNAAMKGNRLGGGERHARFAAPQWVVGAQVALSLVLLAAAGLFLRSFVNLTTQDMGFDRNDVLLIATDLSRAAIPVERRGAALEEIENRLRALPGVAAAAFSFTTPLSNDEWNNIIHNDLPHGPTGDAAVVWFNSISPGYFTALRTPLIAGRFFDADDGKTSSPVAIVNEALARRFYPNINPLGHRFRTEQDGGGFGPAIAIVGVVRSAKYDALNETESATAYFPIAQEAPGGMAGPTFEVRTLKPPTGLIRPAEKAIAQVNSGISLSFATLAGQVADSIVQQRLLALLSSFFGALALALAMIGLYGSFSYLVNRRRAEFGVRLALGAAPATLRRMVMWEVGSVLAAGLAAGALLAAVAERIIASLLFASSRDGLVLVAAAAVLAGVALAAGYWPARRAGRADPMTALRCE
ncbi:MAG: ADOP family duplicated permease [Terriglobales bacterium]